MMMRSRVARLERCRLSRLGTPDLWVLVRAFGPDLSSRGITEIRGGGRAWHRQPHETEDVFRARVVSEAPDPWPRLFVCCSRPTVAGAAEDTTDA